MERLQKNAKFVRHLCQAKSPHDFNKLIKHASVDEIKTLVDLTFNVMKKNIPVGKKYVGQIIENRKYLRHIIDPQYSIKSKKHYIQKGGAGPLGAAILAGLRSAPRVMLAALRAAGPAARAAARATPRAAATVARATPRVLAHSSHKAVKLLDTGAARVTSRAHPISGKLVKGDGGVKLLKITPRADTGVHVSARGVVSKSPSISSLASTPKMVPRQVHMPRQVVDIPTVEVGATAKNFPIITTKTHSVLVHRPMAEASSEGIKMSTMVTPTTKIPTLPNKLAPNIIKTVETSKVTGAPAIARYTKVGVKRKIPLNQSTVAAKRKLAIDQSAVSSNYQPLNTSTPAKSILKQPVKGYGKLQESITPSNLTYADPNLTAATQSTGFYNTMPYASIRSAGPSQLSLASTKSVSVPSQLRYHPGGIRDGSFTSSSLGSSRISMTNVPQYEGPILSQPMFRASIKNQPPPAVPEQPLVIKTAGLMDASSLRNSQVSLNRVPQFMRGQATYTSLTNLPRTAKPTFQLPARSVSEPTFHSTRSFPSLNTTAAQTVGQTPLKAMTTYRQFIAKKGFWRKLKFLVKRGGYEFLKTAPAMMVSTAGSAGVSHGITKLLGDRDTSKSGYKKKQEGMTYSFEQPTRINTKERKKKTKSPPQQFATSTRWRYDQL